MCCLCRSWRDQWYKTNGYNFTPGLNIPAGRNFTDPCDECKRPIAPHFEHASFGPRPGRGLAARLESEGYKGAPPAVLCSHMCNVNHPTMQRSDGSIIDPWAKEAPGTAVTKQHAPHLLQRAGVATATSPRACGSQPASRPSDGAGPAAAGSSSLPGPGKEEQDDKPEHRNETGLDLPNVDDLAYATLMKALVKTKI